MYGIEVDIDFYLVEVDILVKADYNLVSKEILSIKEDSKFSIKKVKNIVRDKVNVV